MIDDTVRAWFDDDRVSYATRTLRHPRLLSMELNRLYFTRGRRWAYNRRGVDVFGEDWDNLVVLDACRCDMFEAIARPEFAGTYRRRISRGSSTHEFLRGNFRGDLTDTVYVTANPQLAKYSSSIRPDLHDVVDVWREEGWDDRFGTVLPGTMAEAGRAAGRRYPEKRLVVHFLQPHYPFLTDAVAADKGYLDREDPDGYDVWGRLNVGRLDDPPAAVVTAYHENLRRALPHVTELVTALGGRTVVTADHGNLLGERAWPIPVRFWGHPTGIYHPQLVRVPWLVLDDGDRRTIAAGDASADAERVHGDLLEERLQDLGYA